MHYLRMIRGLRKSDFYLRMIRMIRMIRTEQFADVILGIFSITNIILEVILVHICMYLFIVTW